MSAGTRAINYISIAVGAAIGAATAWYIYQKTMARARQLEEEEANNVRDTRRGTGIPPRVYSDDPEAQVAATPSTDDAAEDDDIAYFDENDGSGPEDGTYQDDLDSDDVFGQGDGGEDSPAISLHSQNK